METTAKPKTVESRRNVVILFAGDSGDGIQLTGAQFTDGFTMPVKSLMIVPV